ncbi:hypothetical protein [Geminocystis sp. NIES-3709]|uniref:hypothetical protein n=1 Tax=Geminocystis sp. NIES-3709 TaxID=1617448 RepID=UPI0008270BB8|nr:hypothetical protein [Geminocystis sp. NIES-3709]
MTPSNIFPNLNLDGNNLIIPLTDLGLSNNFSGGDLAYRIVQKLYSAGLLIPTIPLGIATDTIRLRYSISFDVIIGAITMLPEILSNNNFGDATQLNDDLQLTD